MNENLVKKIDGYSDVAVDIMEWDFLSMTVGIFKKRFKESIVEPLRLLLNEFNRNPRVAIQSLLQASILGLISGLAQYYKVILSNSAKQTRMNIRENYGSSTSRQVCFIHFQSVTKIRKACLAIVEKDPSAPFIVSRRSLDEMESTFTGRAFAPQLTTLRRAQPGFSFPLLVCWKIAELAPTNCPDTFLEPKIVNHISEASMCAISSSISTEDLDGKKSLYLNALMMAKPDLSPYIDETCATCASSGIERLIKCPLCCVARYCGKEHQVEHWSIHKKHCKRLRFIATLKSDAELYPYLGKVCALCKDPGGGSSGSEKKKKLEKCTRCNVAYYCGRDHQVEHWSVHKYHCKRLQDIKEEKLNP
jgi:hypothetical protein